MNGSSVVVSARIPAIKDHDGGLRRGSCLPSFFNEPVGNIIVSIEENNPLSPMDV